jgi:hypothetical protein
MDKRLRDAIEEQLSQEDGQPSSGRTPGWLPVRLAASLAQGVGGDDNVAGVAPRGTQRVAEMAAFIDDGLARADRDAVVVALAGAADARADLGSALAFLDAVDAEPQDVPSHLSALAYNTLAAPDALDQARIRAVARTSGRRFRPRIVWASLAAVLTLAILAPGAWRLVDERLNQPDVAQDRGLPHVPKHGPARPPEGDASAPGRPSPDPCGDAHQPPAADDQRPGHGVATSKAGDPARITDSKPDDPCARPAPDDSSNRPATDAPRR